MDPGPRLKLENVKIVLIVRGRVPIEINLRVILLHISILYQYLQYLPGKGSAPFGFGIEQFLDDANVSVSRRFKKFLVLSHDQI